MSENKPKFKEGEIVRLVVTGEEVQIVGPGIDADINDPMGCNSHGIAYPCRQFGFCPKNEDENIIRNSMCRINLFMEYELKESLERKNAEFKQFCKEIFDNKNKENICNNEEN